MEVDRTLILQNLHMLTVHLKANIDGAVKLHDLSTWPENQKLFVFCTEPSILAANGGLCAAGVGAGAYE